MISITKIQTYAIRKVPVTRKEAPRSQVQQVVYTDSKKNIMQAYWFKSTLAHPKKVLTFQILRKVWRQWRSLVNQSFGYCSAPVAYNVYCKFDFKFH
jgi:hypothetical protein